MLLCQRGESLVTTRPLMKPRGCRPVSVVVVPSFLHNNRGGMGKSFPYRRHASTSTTAATEEATSQGGLPPWLPSFMTAATGGLLFGSDIGSSSSVVRILGSDGGAAFGDLSALQLGQLASSSLFGAMVASAALIFVGMSYTMAPYHRSTLHHPHYHFGRLTV